ncbi:hypothetical protein POX_c03955 [Penicillium oxalicum]|nr:hypothetical protein POX_c03955 [Penicillium oxalicum]KAI2791100.1 hypothetical protein POX_c03955 [Penicillium oxalicum]
MSCWYICWHYAMILHKDAVVDDGDECIKLRFYTPRQCIQ